MGTRPNVIPPSLLRFLDAQAKGARYVLTVCTGSWALAQAGGLEGRRATTNKAAFKTVVVRTRHGQVRCIVLTHSTGGYEEYQDRMGGESTLGRRRELLDVIWSVCRYVLVAEQWAVSADEAAHPGIDMAAAWLEHLLGADTALVIRSVVEVSARAQDDDDWASTLR